MTVIFLLVLFTESISPSSKTGLARALVSLEHVNFARAYKTENPLHLKYHKQNRAKGKLSGQSRIRVRHEKTVTRWIEWMILSKEEMKQLLKDTGWKIRRFIEDAGTSYIGIISKTA